MTNVIDIGKHRMSRKERKRDRRRRQPAKPRDLRASEVVVLKTAPEEWGVNHEAIALAANADVTASRDYAGRLKRVMRYDVFAILFYSPRSRMSEASYDAVRRLQADMAVLHRTQGACEVIRATGAGSSGAVAMITENFSLARVQAGDRINTVMAGMRPWCWRLVRELCEAEVINGQAPNWHAIVQRHTGEIDRHRRGELVRDACDDLAASYRRIDNEPRERVA